MKSDFVGFEKPEDDTPGIQDLEPFIVALDKVGEKVLAEKCLDAFAKTAVNFFQFENLSKCYFKVKSFDKCMHWSERCLADCKSNELAAIIRKNLTNVYNQNNYPEKALPYILMAEKTKNDATTQMEKAYCYYLLNRKMEAKDILEKILVDFPELDEQTKVKIKFNLGTYYLYQDKLQKGLRHFMLEGAKMNFWKIESIFSRNKKLNLDFWEGEPGIKNLVVYAEAGIGDEIINVRFMKHLKDMGINAYWYTATQEGQKGTNDRPGLTELLVKNNVPVITDLKEVEHLDDKYWTYSMRLPIYLNCEYKDLWYGSYLKACPDFVKKWELKGKKLKVGVRWRGAPHYEQDLHRSYKLKLLYEAVGDMDAEFHSLQKGDGVEELEDFPGIIDHSSELNTLEDTMALINNLDFIITSCTSVLHMAGSQGKKAYLMVPISAYYPWCHTGDKSPWYGDNLTLLRQEKPRSWAEPMNKLKLKLKEERYLND